MFQASKLLDSTGVIVTDDIIKLGELIAATDADASFDEHTSKLKRIEIGIALRQAAAIPRQDGNASTLTETISEMGLCKMLDRAEKTFLKYARIAGEATLLALASNPNVSLSALDEIASCKKPIDPTQRREFMKRLRDQIVASTKEENEKEGQEPDSYRGTGPTRGDVVGMIRRAQIDFAVPTKGGGEERGENKKQDQLLLLQRMSRLVGCFRVLFLPGGQRDEWFQKNDITIEKFGRHMSTLRDKLIADGMIENDPMDIAVTRLFPMPPAAKAAPESQPNQDHEQAV